MTLVRWFRSIAAAVGLALVLAGCAMDGPRSIMRPAGDVAQIQLDLFMFTFWLSVAVLVLVGAALIYALIRFRSRPSDKGIPKQVHGSVLVEAIWTTLPVIIIIMIAIPTVRAIFETETRFDPTEDDIVVNVMGHQWWWSFEYPDLGIVTANELRFPVDRRLVLNVDSADVLHSFWVPRLGGKIDLIPGQDNRLWLASNEVGEFYGHCAELCLGAHAYMRFRVFADTPEDFDAWVETFQQAQVPELAAQAPAAPAQSELVQQGEALFGQKGCTACHNVSGYLAEGLRTGTPNYPDLTNFGLRETVAAAVLANTPENLAAWLSDPQAIKPGNYMPTLWAADDPDREEEIAAVAAYLLSLGVTGEESGEDLAMGGAN